MNMIPEISFQGRIDYISGLEKDRNNKPYKDLLITAKDYYEGKSLPITPINTFQIRFFLPLLESIKLFELGDTVLFSGYIKSKKIYTKNGFEYRLFIHPTGMKKVNKIKKKPL